MLLILISPPPTHTHTYSHDLFQRNYVDCGNPESDLKGLYNFFKILQLRHCSVQSLICI